MDIRASLFTHRRTLFLVALLLVALAGITYAQAGGWWQPKRGGENSDRPSVAVHPRLRAAVKSYERCVTSDGTDPVCLEKVAFRFRFYNTIDDELAVRIRLGPGGNGHEFAAWAERELAETLVVDESWNKGVKGHLVDHRLRELVDALRRYEPGGKGSKVLPGETVVSPGVTTIVTESWVLPHGPDTTGLHVDCVDPKIHHAYVVRQADTPFDPESYPQWPPVDPADIALMNPVDVDGQEFVLTKNLLRDEQFCYANPGNADPFCQRLTAATGSGLTGLPALWTGTAMPIEEPLSPYGAWVDAEFLDEELQEIVGDHVTDFEGFYFPESNPMVVGWRDEARVSFWPYEEFDFPCVWMGLTVPFFAPSPVEAVEVTLDLNGTQTLDLVYPDFEGEAEATFLMCWSGVPSLGTYPSLEDGIEMGLVSVYPRGIQIHPQQNPTVVAGGTGTAGLQADLTQALQDGIVDPVPFYSAAFVVPFLDLLSQWDSQAATFFGLYAKRINNRVGTDPDTGSETITTIAGITPMWDSDGGYAGDCMPGYGSLAGVSIVVGDAADAGWFIGPHLSSLAGRNVGSNDTRWASMDSDTIENISPAAPNTINRTDWLRDYDAMIQTPDGTQLPHPLNSQAEGSVIVDLLGDLLSGVLTQAAPAYHASYPDGDYCGDTWGAVGEVDTLADEVWSACLAAVTDDVDPADREELCTYYLHEVAVAFYDVCVQPKAMPMSQNSKCSGITSISVSNPEFSAGELRWDEVSTDYYDAFIAGAGGCTAACNVPGVFDIVDSYVFDAPAPYVSREFADTDGDRFPDTYLTYVNFPAWVNLTMDIDASFVIDVDEGCPGDYDPPNMSKKAAYLDRLLDLDQLEFWAYGGTLPPSLVAERERLDDFVQNEPNLYPGSDWEDHRDNVFLLDDAVNSVAIEGGTLEVLLGVEWSFPIHEDREWEWMAQRWANNVVPDKGDIVAGTPPLTSADLTLSIDGICLHLDENEDDVQGSGPAAGLLENTFYNMAEAPCAAGSALLGSNLDLGSQMEMSLPVTYFSNDYWDTADAMLADHTLPDEIRLAANRTMMTSSLQEMYVEGRVGAMMEPALITAMTYGGNGGPDYPMEYWPASIIETINPRRVAVYPRMLLMDELMREGFYTWDVANQWSMDELFVSSVSYGYTYDVETWGYWTGPNIPVNEGHVFWYAFEPEFSAYDNESLATILGVDPGWSQYAGQEFYSVLDDNDLFGQGSDWMPHDHALRRAEHMPAWCPGRPNDQL